MQTTITLQEPFSYSLIPIVLLAVALILLTVMLVRLWAGERRIKKKKEFTKQEPPTPEQYSLFLEDVKAHYLDRVAELEKALSEDNVGQREGYQELSKSLRCFVSEVTGIEMTKMTLSEIQKLKMPHVRELIADFYAPEFAPGTRTGTGSELRGAIDKTKRIIREWK